MSSTCGLYEFVKLIAPFPLVRLIFMNGGKGNHKKLLGGQVLDALRRSHEARIVAPKCSTEKELVQVKDRFSDGRKIYGGRIPAIAASTKNVIAKDVNIPKTSRPLAAGTVTENSRNEH